MNLFKIVTATYNSTQLATKEYKEINLQYIISDGYKVIAAINFDTKHPNIYVYSFNERIIGLVNSGSSSITVPQGKVTLLLCKNDFL